MRKFLLDTGIVLGYVRSAGYAEYVDKKFDVFANTPLVSVVSKGEIYSLAIQRNWGLNKLKLLDELLRKLPLVDINHDQIIRLYAEIDAYSLGRNSVNLSHKLRRLDRWGRMTCGSRPPLQCQEQPYLQQTTTLIIWIKCS